MKINLDDLKKITEIIFNYLKEDGKAEIELDHDYYWKISYPQIYDMNEDPKEIDIGQLFDDWESLKRIYTTKDPPLGYAMTWLSSIFRYIGEKNVR